MLNPELLKPEISYCLEEIPDSFYPSAVIIDTLLFPYSTFFPLVVPSYFSLAESNFTLSAGSQLEYHRD